MGYNSKKQTKEKMKKNKWFEFVVIGIVISLLLENYTNFESWVYIFIAFVYGYTFDYIFNRPKMKK